MKAVMTMVLGVMLAAPAWAQGPGPAAGPGPGMGPGQGGGMGPGGGPGGGPRGRGMGMGPGPRDVLDPEVIDGLSAEIGVDQATLAKIKSLVYGANREAIDLRAAVQRERLTLRQLLDDSQPDTRKVLQQVDAVGAAETRMRKNRVQLILGVRNLLTPEQRQKLQKIMGERRGTMRGAGPAWGGGEGEPD